jgi:hypothetical protein
MPTLHTEMLDSFYLQDGRTPLYIAARGDHKDVVVLLLDRGAEVNAAKNVSAIPTLYSGSHNLVMQGACMCGSHHAGSCPKRDLLIH